MSKRWFTNAGYSSLSAGMLAAVETRAMLRAPGLLELSADVPKNLTAKVAVLCMTRQLSGRQNPGSGLFVVSPGFTLTGR